MHIMITKLKREGKDFEYAKIAESYRENGKVKKKILMNLGAIKSETDRKKFIEILNDMKKGEEFIRKKILFLVIQNNLASHTQRINFLKNMK